MPIETEVPAALGRSSPRMPDRKLLRASALSRTYHNDQYRRRLGDRSADCAQTQRTHEKSSWLEGCGRHHYYHLMMQLLMQRDP